MNIYKHLKSLAISSMCALVLVACGGSTKEVVPYTETRFFFDTLITVTIYEDRQDVLDKVITLCEEYQDRFSLKGDGSEIRALNESNGETITVTDELLEIINLGLEYSELTQGLFDLSIRPLTELWSIGKDNQKIPTNEEIRDALSLVDYKNILVDGNEVTLLNKDMLLDFGAISKGYIADKLKELMVDEGIESGIINLGGNIHTIGNKPDGSKFSIGIQKPFGKSTESSASAEVSDKAVVTAGVYERYFMEDENLYHHILNPITGQPAQSDLWGVSIIAEDAVNADVLSTVCFLLGQKEAKKLIESLDDVEAIFVTEELEVVEIN